MPPHNHGVSRIPILNIRPGAGNPSCGKMSASVALSSDAVSVNLPELLNSATFKKVRKLRLLAFGKRTNEPLSARSVARLMFWNSARRSSAAVAFQSSAAVIFPALWHMNHKQPAKSKQRWDQHKSVKPQYPGFERVGFQSKLAFNLTIIMQQQPCRA